MTTLSKVPRRVYICHVAGCRVRVKRGQPFCYRHMKAVGIIAKRA